MPDVNDFFSFQNSVTDISDNDYLQTLYYLESIKAFARLSNKSIYIIDYQTKGFEYVSDNPLLLCGHTSEEVQKMGYEFYLKYVIKNDLNLLLTINNVGFEFYENIPLKERIDHSISYDFHLVNQEGKTILINQKLTPLFLTEEGKIWKALCIVSLSSSTQSGNIRVNKKGSQKFFEYNLEKRFWEPSIAIQLTDREKEILQLSIRGFKVDEIAEEVFISSNTVKFHRKKLFEKLEVSNIVEAISFATQNALI